MCNDFLGLAGVVASKMTCLLPIHMSPENKPVLILDDDDKIVLVLFAVIKLYFK